ncbi:MAG: hypothetical protein U1E65_25720 [Myxococcota bacterium]
MIVRYAYLLPALTLAACSCEGTSVGQNQSRLVSDLALIDFGRVFIGSERTITATLTVEGDVPVTFRAELSGDASGILAGPAAGRLPPGRPLHFDVTFRPNRVGPIEAQVDIDSDAALSATIAIALRGIGVQPPDCEDGNGCTLDTFDPSTGRCTHMAQAVACNDFSACTQNDTCVDGVCLGASMSCDDTNPCTDDFCDPASGCVHEATQDCDDHNPCTADSCDLVSGCHHEALMDGTPCDDGKLCTTADICVAGQCAGINIPDGFPCDDNDPCSLHDQCVMGNCKDPTYDPPALGELAFTTTVGALAPDAPANPIIDGLGVTYAGLWDGMAAVDQCGNRKWIVHGLGTPRMSAATSIPGSLFVPFGDRIKVLDPRDGSIKSEVRLDDAFGPRPARTASTATVSVSVVDAALRGSGTLVVSLRRDVTGRSTPEGLIVEVDRETLAPSTFLPLGSRIARRVAIDRDEALLVILSDGHSERLVRFGLGGLPATSWSTSLSSTTATELAIGVGGRAFWTVGLTSVTSGGRALTLVPPTRPFRGGSPVVRGQSTLSVILPLDLPALDGAGEPGFQVVSVRSTTTATGSPILWSTPIPGSVDASSPTLDRDENIYFVTRDPAMIELDRFGGLVFRTQLPFAVTSTHAVALGITDHAKIVVISDGRVSAVQGEGTLLPSAWPRHRRDNLSTGHR